MFDAFVYTDNLYCNYKTENYNSNNFFSSCVHRKVNNSLFFEGENLALFAQDIKSKLLVPLLRVTLGF